MNALRTAFFIAYKSIVRGRRSTFALTIFILSLSFLNMLFISGVLTGLSNSFVDVLRDLSSAEVMITPQEEPKVKQFITNQNELRRQIETIPGVIATARNYLMAGSLAFDKDRNGQYKNVSGSIVGVDPAEERRVLTIGNDLAAGQFISQDDTDQIVLSSALAGGYGDFAPSDLGGVKVGDKVRVTYENGIVRTYTVKGIYRDSIQLYESFISAREAESVLSTYDTASQILVKADLSVAPAQAYEDRIHSMAPDLVVKNYMDLLGQFTSFLNALNFISFIISVISVIVAAVTIFILIYVSAMSKRRQIGILKAIGIREDTIIYSYLIQSLFYTLCGISIGLLFAFGVLRPLLVAYPIPVVEDLINLTLAFTPVAVGASILSFIVAGFFAGRVPARLVTRGSILDAIRGS